MSSIRRHDTSVSRTTTIAFSIAFVLLLALTALAPVADAAKSRTSTTKSALPKITKVDPLTDVYVGQTLKLTGKNFVKGKKTLVVMFRRDGSTRKFTARGSATSTTRATVVVPDVTGDLVRSTQTTGGPLDNMFRLRPITKFGAAKAWTGTSISPRMAKQSATSIPTDTGTDGDCDKDGIRNGLDPDDDNDLLDDIGEQSIGTDICNIDTDNDDASDFYEYTVAFDYNGGPVLPYPALRPYPNPLVADSGTDFDGDGLTTHGEYRAWQYTGLMARFYSDADQDSDGDGKIDSAEDEDHDLLPNYVELKAFQSGNPVRDLNWLKTDTDGDGLCDGLDDQDHDGPPTALAVADCSSIVPNNGPGGTPPTSAIDSAPGGDPDGSRIDGDDNRYSNFYEWYTFGADPNSPGDSYDPCMPSVYPVSPYCPAPWNPLPTPDP
ncbi:MAG: hypothetical protein JHD02_05805 [Thermoleophilaceae bacterium]|nr:hypothetical protein [Thermoleophilaceae bacterium]